MIFDLQFEEYTGIKYYTQCTTLELKRTVRP